jgi:glucose/arabinose dehydrogenase
VTHAIRRSSSRPLALVGALALVAAIAGPAAAGPRGMQEASTGAAGAASAQAPRTGAATPAALEPAVTLDLDTFRSGLSQPVFATNAGDGTNRVYIVEKAGRIKVLSSTGGYLGTLLNITDRTSKGGEQGLLGLAFHPSYETNHKYYVNYTDRAGDTIIVEYRSSSNGLATVGGQQLLKIDQPYANHNGGMIAFGQDGYLYIATGDGGNAGDPGNRAQSLNSHLGKLLRMDVNSRTSTRRYGIPSTNPYVGKTGLDLIFSRGLRNPWRFSFDRSTDAIWIGDVGQGRYEEIDTYPWTGNGPGHARNYGWRVREGSACYRPSSGCTSPSGYVAPVYVYSHSGNGGGNCSITGGYVYRGTDHPALQGLYLFADVCSGRIWSLVAANPTGGATLLRTIGGSPVSFGEDEDGEMFLVSLTGTVYRIGGS